MHTREVPLLYILQNVFLQRNALHSLSAAATEYCSIMIHNLLFKVIVQFHDSARRRPAQLGKKNNPEKSRLKKLVKSNKSISRKKFLQFQKWPKINF